MSDEQINLAIAQALGDACSFCGQTKPPEQLHPDEGGDWICDETYIKQKQETYERKNVKKNQAGHPKASETV